MILRMGFLARLVLSRPKRIPLLARHDAEVCQGRNDHRPFVQPSNASQQFGNGRSRGCNSGGKSKPVRRPLRPAFRKRVQQPATTVGQIDQASFAQQYRPLIEHSPKSLD